ncbi:hypothetical protein [Corynebacterium lipophiloflavum]|uniref:Uncharacterized protein n=1 Tax=Corynebacterium lipophiloflavum (strain ATCC 700352 / DSM 44291 / CCUG 37336 / JCM 10383 / DMMZ 1944) TaxID=525263 RepID=C0XS33_CORLD|nr:hypothetical protein [Corynebacterium lipophiloflavum]EEI16928.1 hypothetical protein HMPREF0298_1253 [Corynebacterium lipophiloflavum DSM 44291]
MTLQPRPNNPIEARKQAVRRYSRNAIAFAGGGVVGGVALGFLLGSPFSFTILILGLIIGVVGGFVNYNKVQKIVNHKDNF